MHISKGGMAWLDLIVAVAGALGNIGAFFSGLIAIAHALGCTVSFFKKPGCDTSHYHSTQPVK
jgi:hypothetical protein